MSFRISFARRTDSALAFGRVDPYFFKARLQTVEDEAWRNKDYTPFARA